MNSRPPDIDEIFIEAVEIDDPAARSSYLDKVCGQDLDLKRRVGELLVLDHLAGDFLESPPSASIVAFQPAFPEGPGTDIGPYTLLESIGEGGMGTVFMAEQARPVHRKVALKVIKPGMDSKQVVARFESERQALAMMDHPNIAKVFDAGATDSGRPYFVMELIRGIPITDYCDKACLSVPERLELFVLVCLAVQHAHQKGIIHRDLKPSNVLVTLIDGAAVPKVIDFGVAKATSGQLTDKSLFTGFAQLIGTPLYMSPEQADLSGVDVDTRSDIYALGVLLYELLTGTTPIDRDTLCKAAYDEIRRIIREQEPPTPSTRLGTLGETLAAVSANRHAESRKLCHSVRGDLDWIVMKSLEKDRRRRYETANDFAADVMRHLTDRPVEACPPSAWYRFKKYARRNRPALTTATMIALALVGGTVVSAWQAIRATTAQRGTVAALVQAQANYEEAEAQRRRAEGLQAGAESLLSRSLIRTGVHRLEEGTALGLFDLIDAHAAAEHDAGLRAASSGLWAAWFGPLEGALAMVLEGGGAVAFSPDGSRLAVASRESVQLWEAHSWRRLGPPLPHRSGTIVQTVAFSPDGALLATATDRGGVRLWEVSTGRARGGPLREDVSNPSITAGQRRVAFSPDGTLLTAGSLDKIVQVWEVATGRSVSPPLRHPAYVHHVTFSLDGSILATGAESKETVWLWRVGTWELIGSPLMLPSTWGHQQELSPDGTLLAVSSTNAVWLSTFPDGRPHCGPLTTRGTIRDLAFSPDGSRLATADADWNVQLWDTATGRPLGEALRQGGAASRVRFSPDGGLLACASQDGLVRLWDVESRLPIGFPLPQGDNDPGNASGVEPTSLQFSPDGRLLVVGYASSRYHSKQVRSTRIWRVDRVRWSREHVYDAPVEAFDLSPDGRRLATISGSVVRMWETETGRQTICPLSVKPRMIAFGAGGSWLAVSESTNVIHLLDTATGQLVGRPITLGFERLTRVASSPDGKLLATATFGGGTHESFVRLWDASTRELVETLGVSREIGAGGSWVFDLVFSLDGRYLAAGCGDWGTRVWDLDHGSKTPKVLWSDDSCLAVGFSPGGTRLAVGTRGGFVEFWDPATGRRAEPSLRLEGSVGALKFLPQGRLLATKIDGGPAQLWDLTLGPPYQAVTVPQTVSDGGLLALDASGKHLAVGLPGRGMVRLFHLPEPPATTREMQLQTWVALGTRAERGEYQAIPVEEWQALRDELPALKAKAEVPVEDVTPDVRRHHQTIPGVGLGHKRSQ
jgi:eukaryotic-like serine/threonine-protein kinase